MTLSFDALLQNANVETTTTTTALNSSEESAPAVNASDKDYRGFVFVHHHQHGLLLLKCTRKKNKPIHYQLPGGHVDDHEFEAASKKTDDPSQQLQIAASNGCARELFEETGLDIRSSMERLKPVTIASSSTPQTVPNIFKSRLFYLVQVTDDDFYNYTKEPGYAAKLTKPEEGAPNDVMLKLSVEHAGFKFEKSAERCYELLQHHSGGKVAEVLKMVCGS